MNLKLTTKNDLKTIFSVSWNNVISGKTKEKVKKHKDIKLLTNERRRNYLVPEHII